MSLNKTIRLRTTPGSASGLDPAGSNILFKIEQEFDTLDILSLKITQADAYRNFCSDYGVVVGRVIANDGFGVENAKVSIFIPLSDEDIDRPEITTIYPYRTTTDTDAQGIRYNLLPKDGRRVIEYASIPNTINPNNNPNYSCSHNGTPITSWTQLTTSVANYEGDIEYARGLDLDYGPRVPVGTFPSKSDILDNDTVLEVYDKYYKFTTTTNSAGDYMLFGVPVGIQTVHMDVDLSDTGNVSLVVQDFINAGFPPNLFNGNNFKSSTNLDSLPQIESRDTSIEVIPFWGNLDLCEIGITRLDFNLNKSIIPSAVLFFHSFTNIGTYIKGKNIRCNIANGDVSDMADIHGMQAFETTTIAYSPFTLQSFTKESVGPNTVIKVPMYEDRKITNEFGQLVSSPDPNKGIPTRGRYRFYINPKNPVSGEDTNYRATYIFPDYIDGPDYVTLKYDLENRQTRWYTLGNMNLSGRQSTGSENNRRTRIEGTGIGPNLRYPTSCVTEQNRAMFGKGSVCYGSLYFPRFEVDDDGNYCSYTVSSVGDNTGLMNVFDRDGNNIKYSDNALHAYSLLDMTFLIKKFTPFGGNLPITSALHGGTINGDWVEGLGSNQSFWYNGAVIQGLAAGLPTPFIPPPNPLPCSEPFQGNTIYPNLSLQVQTIPLKNTPINVQAPANSPNLSMNSIGFPDALNDDQKKPNIGPLAAGHQKIIQYATFVGGNSGYVVNVQNGTRSLPGRYYFYLGLTESSSIIKYLKDTEDV